MAEANLNKKIEIFSATPGTKNWAIHWKNLTIY